MNHFILLLVAAALPLMTGCRSASPSDSSSIKIHTRRPARNQKTRMRKVQATTNGRTTTTQEIAAFAVVLSTFREFRSAFWTERTPCSSGRYLIHYSLINHLGVEFVSERRHIETTLQAKFPCTIGGSHICCSLAQRGLLSA